MSFQVRTTLTLSILFICLGDSQSIAQDATYQEQYRPQFHFSPAVN